MDISIYICKVFLEALTLSLLLIFPLLFSSLNLGYSEGTVINTVLFNNDSVHFYLNFDLYIFFNMYIIDDR